MALLTSGYWQSTYWPSNYWQEDYWPEYGTGGPPPAAVPLPPSIAGPRRKVPRPFELSLEEVAGILTVIRRRRRAKHN